MPSVQEEPESVEEQICKNCEGVIRSLDRRGESCDLGSPRERASPFGPAGDARRAGGQGPGRLERNQLDTVGWGVRQER